METAGRALAWGLGVGVVAAAFGALLAMLAPPVSLISGAGLILLAASPLIAISTGVVVAVAGRARKTAAAPDSAAGQAALDRLPPLPEIGFVRIGYYRLKRGMADAVARRAHVEMQRLFARDPGFISLQMVRCGADELISISQWETRQQAEAAVEREIGWMRLTVVASVAATESHVGAVVLSERS